MTRIFKLERYLRMSNRMGQTLKDFINKIVLDSITLTPQPPFVKLSFKLNSEEPFNDSIDSTNNTIESIRSSFVKTSSFNNIINVLEKHEANAVVLVGKSGIGKTDTSLLVANYFMEEYKYKFKYISCPGDIDENNLQGVRTMLKKTKNQKEIMIFDDVFDSKKVHNSEKYFEILEFLIDFVYFNKNKKIIFTTINAGIDYVKSYSTKIYNLFENRCEIIDLDLDLNDRFNIFLFYIKQNQIWNNLRQLCIEEKWNNGTILKIISHDNFTPLLIINGIKKCKKVSVDDYESTILKRLDNPELVWEEELKTLDFSSQQYLKILYSLSNTIINKDIVEECFDRYIEDKPNCKDFTYASIYYQIDSLIICTDTTIDFIHTSLKEYVGQRITDQEREDIIETAKYLDQVEMLDRKNTYIKKQINKVDDKGLPLIFKYSVLPQVMFISVDSSFIHESNIVIKYLEYLYKLKIQEDQHKSLLVAALEAILKLGERAYLVDADIILNVFKLKYDFTEIYENKEYVKSLYSYTNSDNVWFLIQKTVIKDDRGYDYLKMDSYIQDHINQVLQLLGEDYFITWIDENINDYIKFEIEDYEEDNLEAYTEDIITNVNDNLAHKFDFKIIQGEIERTIQENQIYNFDIKQINDWEFDANIIDIISEAVDRFLIENGN